LHIQRFEDNVYGVHAVQENTMVLFCGKHAQIFGTPLLRARSCGLCGDLNAETTADLKTPERCIMSRPRFDAYSYMIQESCQGIPSQDLAKYQQEKTRCVKQEIIPTTLDQDTKTSGLIYLHGLSNTKNDVKNKIKYIRSLGLDWSKTRVKTPMAPYVPVNKIPLPLTPGMPYARSWFNFWKMPGKSVISPKASESKKGLERSMKQVEEEIEKMIEEGIPSENIVLTGTSQGGALTLYTALHTKYKIGGFIPIVAWQPLLMPEPPSKQPVPANKDTPIFHMNGIQDLIVPSICGSTTSAALNQVFTRYEMTKVFGTHWTIINKWSVPIIHSWLRSNVPGMALGPL
jgi:predicted esterase